MEGIVLGSEVEVSSSDECFVGIVDEKEWDFDHWIYKVNGRWWAESEVNEI